MAELLFPTWTFAHKLSVSSRVVDILVALKLIYFFFDLCTTLRIIPSTC